ncbi:MAG: Glu/Leu/Phe/Val dehydrogenase [Chloroflexi bacterium]|nr:Glu/Leu/Phe/Val dehydrogenase [Chloroflexota bacterium]
MASKHFLDLVWNDPQSSATGYLVIDQLVRGIAGGGCRMRPGCTMEEAARLAQTMTLKFALFDVPIGGAKVGIDYDPGAPDADEVLYRFFEAIAPYLRGSYITGPDMGTHENQILKTLQRVGIRSPYYAAIQRWGLTPEAEDTVRRALALKTDGMTLDGFIAGYGVSVCALEALKHKNFPINAARVGLQGFGSVGGAAARYLAQAGAKIVAVADIEGTVARREGLDVELLLKSRNALGMIDRSRLPGDYAQLGADAWFTEPSDVLIPAALADTIDVYKAEQVKAAIVVEGANFPLTAKAEQALHARGVVIIPDFLANSAFAYISGALLMGAVGADADAILKLVAERLQDRTRRVLDGIERGVPPREQVIAIAEENLARLRAE